MKSKYFYDGIPLVEYCKKHPELKYNNLTKYISVELKKDPSRSAEDIIKEFITTKHKTYTRYLINGMSLYRYCEFMNISYDAIAKDISRSRKDERYKDIEDDELVSIILDKHIMGDNIQDIMDDEPKTYSLKLNNKE